MYEQAPKEEELAQWGLTYEDVAADREVWLWPDNVQTVSVFRSIETQWRMGPSGPVGLDYTVIPLVMRARGIDKAAFPEVFDGLQVMEAAALEAIHKRLNND